MTSYEGNDDSEQVRFYMGRYDLSEQEATRRIVDESDFSVGSPRWLEAVRFRRRELERERRETQ